MLFAMTFTAVGAEPTPRQPKKDRILGQVEVLEQATIALIDRRLSRELRERARQETAR